MKDLVLTAFGQTDVGMQRTGNEDSFLVADLAAGSAGPISTDATFDVADAGSLLVVSDGMGGALAGEIASALAVSTIRESLATSADGVDLVEQLKRATETANLRIWEEAQQNAEYSGMGATVTAVLIQGHTAYIAQVGDSRAYMLRDDDIRQLTKDQSLAQLLVDSGVLNDEQFANFPQKNVIMQALGTQPTVNVALTSVELCPDDCLLVCSDGLSNKVEAAEMLSIVRDSPQLSEAGRRLIQMANERGGEDNITVVLGRIAGETSDSPRRITSILESVAVINQDYMGAAAADIASHFRENEQQSESAGEEPQPPVADAVTAILSAPAPPDDPLDPVAVATIDEVPTQAEESSAFEDAANNPADQAPEPQPTAVVRSSAPPQSAIRGYLPIIIIGILSLLLLAATYFFYGHYIRSSNSDPIALEKSATSST